MRNFFVDDGLPLHGFIQGEKNKLCREGLREDAGGRERGADRGELA